MAFKINFLQGFFVFVSLCGDINTKVLQETRISVILFLITEVIYYLVIICFFPIVIIKTLGEILQKLKGKKSQIYHLYKLLLLLHDIFKMFKYQ